MNSPEKVTANFSSSYRTPPVANQYTAILRKVVGQNVHTTIPKGNMGYDRYSVPDDCSCQIYF